MWYYSPEFSTQRMTVSNPFNQMVKVDGFIVPLDTLPEDVQQLVKEARAKGGDLEFKTR